MNISSTKSVCEWDESVDTRATLAHVDDAAADAVITQTQSHQPIL